MHYPLLLNYKTNNYCQVKKNVWLCIITISYDKSHADLQYKCLDYAKQGTGYFWISPVIGHKRLEIRNIIFLA